MKTSIVIHVVDTHLRGAHVKRPPLERRIFTTSREAFLEGRAHNFDQRKAKLMGDPLSGRPHNTDYRGERVVGVSILKYIVGQGYPKGRRKYKRYKKRLGDWKVQYSKKFLTQDLQQKSSQNGYNAGCHNNDPILEVSYLALAKAFLHLRMRNLLVSRQSDLLHPRELPNKNNKQKQQTGSISNGPSRLISRKWHLPHKSPTHILKIPQRFQKIQYWRVLKKADACYQTPHSDRHNNNGQRNEHGKDRNKSCRCEVALLRHFHGLFLSWVRSPVILSLLYLEFQLYTRKYKRKHIVKHNRKCNGKYTYDLQNLRGAKC